MYKPLILSFTLLATSAEAKKCISTMIPVHILARQGIFDVPIMNNNLDATAFSQNLTSISGNFTNAALTGYKTVTGNVRISAEFCHPDQADKKPVVQLLTHGIGFDKTYWDLPYGNYNYSYVNMAVDTYGYSTLAIDRFGIGSSSIADPLSVIQAPATMSAMYEITKKLRAGTLPGVPQRFQQVIHVGHSFGSVLTYELVSEHPDASDGIILTGYSQNGSYVSAATAALNLQLARLNDPARFGTLPTGYLTWADIGCNQYDFFWPGNYEAGMLEYSEAHKMPTTVGELLTLGCQPAWAPVFTGPVMVMTGGADSWFCGFDCHATGDPAVASIPAAVQLAFPAAEAFETYIQPNTGHSLNMHFNATAGYRVMLDFLEKHNLSARVGRA